VSDAVTSDPTVTTTAPSTTAAVTATTLPPTTPAPTTQPTTTTQVSTTVAPTTTEPVDPLLIQPGVIDDGTHVGYLVGQSTGFFSFDKADIGPDGVWINENPAVRVLPVGNPLSLTIGTPIVVVIQDQRVLSTTPTTDVLPTPPPPPPDPVEAFPGTPYVVPTPEAGASWADTHAAYPATDLFVPSDCGGDVVSPVNGTVLEVRRDDPYDPNVDNPATRGGRSISILADDGVRYYLSHFESIRQGINVGSTLFAGQLVGQVGDSGRSSACHIHFGISPPCPGQEWSVRRGVVWPYPYLDAWRDGVQASPVNEVEAWLADNPTACADAAADPNAPDA
jgi:murein DD-endopeptidase MepM/ murein hydrolase activator NlpD